MSEKEHHAVSDGHNIDDPDQNVDKIREILFGGQMRDYQHRFDELESNISAASENLRNDLANRIESLEGFVRRELELLGERMINDRRERVEERENNAAELQDMRRRFEESLTRLDEQTAGETRAIRSALQEKSLELVQVIQQSRDEFNSMLSRQANQLEDRKVSREDLAALLSEVALRLNRELDLPSD
ncbi:MAG: hypothetical protein KJO54_05605 [Gammaproteobacteria bacterium]|nr:hypothetical protein [Gammaproteobacteria bacterium]NNF62064.1 hypothetical protein [Gammaproteobacteria bacterium]NNM20675.1 hypothetical protein [Gammaproteobacteria bacterium]